jgi:hypothetical protein
MSVPHARGVSVRVQHAAVPLSGDLAVDSHGADPDEPPNVRLVHRPHDTARHRLEVAGEIRVDHVLAAHRLSQRDCVKDVAFDHVHAWRRVAREPADIPEVQRQSRVALRKEHVGHDAGDAARRAENQHIHLAYPEHVIIISHRPRAGALQPLLPTTTPRLAGTPCIHRLPARSETFAATPEGAERSSLNFRRPWSRALAIPSYFSLRILPKIVGMVAGSIISMSTSFSDLTIESVVVLYRSKCGDLI